MTCGQRYKVITRRREAKNDGETRGGEAVVKELKEVTLIGFGGGASASIHGKGSGDNGVEFCVMGVSLLGYYKLVTDDEPLNHHCRLMANTLATTAR